MKEITFEELSKLDKDKNMVVDNINEQRAEIEKSIRKKFHKSLFSSFARACKEYELIKEGDHIAVCISGGKDSMLMAKLFQQLQTHRKFPFELVVKLG